MVYRYTGGRLVGETTYILIYNYFLFCFDFEVDVAYGAKIKLKNLSSNTLFNASKLPLHLMYSNRCVSVYKNE